MLDGFAPSSEPSSELCAMWCRRGARERQWRCRRDGTAGEPRGGWDRSVFGRRLQGARGIAGGEGLIVGPADRLAYEGRKPVLRERSSAGRNIGVDHRQISTFTIAFRGMPRERDIRLCARKGRTGEVFDLFFNMGNRRRMLASFLGAVLMRPSDRKMGNRPQSLIKFNKCYAR